MDYILSGDPKEINKILRENQIRVQRGWVSFTPCTRVDTDDKYVVMGADSKELPKDADSKTNTKRRAKKTK